MYIQNKTPEIFTENYEEKTTHYPLLVDTSPRSPRQHRLITHNSKVTVGPPDSRSRLSAFRFTLHVSPHHNPKPETRNPKPNPKPNPDPSGDSRSAGPCVSVEFNQKNKKTKNADRRRKSRPNHNNARDTVRLRSVLTGEVNRLSRRCALPTATVQDTRPTNY